MSPCFTRSPTFLPLAARMRTLTGITARLFNAQAGIRNNLVPYASASAGIQDALAGRVDAIVVDLAATTPYIKHGDLRLLATTSASRLKNWETTPALSETLKGFDMPGWFAVVAPAGTPKTVIARVNKDINAALADPELAAKIATIGPIVDAGRSPEQTAAFLQREHDRWSVVADFKRSECGAASPLVADAPGSPRITETTSAAHPVFPPSA